jgi:excisionase family DNA binding protein
MEAQHMHTLKQVEQISNASTSTIYREIRAGKLRAVKRGRRTYVFSEDLLRWQKSLSPFAPQVAA